MFPYQEPFGKIEFDEEEKWLMEHWKDHFYAEAEFIRTSLEPDKYIVIGSKGSGKSSLAFYYKYQSDIERAKCAHINKKSFFYDSMLPVADQINEREEQIIDCTQQLWESVIIECAVRYADTYTDHQETTSAGIVSNTLADIVSRILSSKNITRSRDLIEKIRIYNTSTRLTDQLTDHYNLLSRRPLIIAIDTNEVYDTSDKAAMCVVAALIQAAKRINSRYSSKGIHVKVFIPREIYFHLAESVITNFDKYITGPVHISWSEDELLRFICWRYHNFILRSGQVSLHKYVDWNSTESVKQLFWNRYFPDTLNNNNGVSENSLGYIIRHTQMRPRQLVKYCNRIANISHHVRSSHRFSSLSIKQALLDIENEQVLGVINAYSRAYPNCSFYMSALTGSDAILTGAEIYKRFNGHISLHAGGSKISFQSFSKMLTSMSIIGRVTDRYFHKASNTTIYRAEFEFDTRKQLSFSGDDHCAVHPMFYQRLRTIPRENTIMYPVGVTPHL
ncbi:MAG: hypothetical protein AAGI71_18425 [Bacteroidota bacterium]